MNTDTYKMQAFYLFCLDAKEIIFILNKLLIYILAYLLIFLQPKT